LKALASKTVFTGMIDEFYGYRFGNLDYRSLRLNTRPWVSKLPGQCSCQLHRPSDSLHPDHRAQAF